MKNKQQLELLVSLIIIFLIPLLIFAVTVTPSQLWYIGGLLNGDSTISIHINNVDIVSKIVMGFTSFSLFYVMLLIASASIVFFSSIALVVKMVLWYRLKRQTTK
jgi:hypothetical protein